MFALRHLAEGGSVPTGPSGLLQVFYFFSPRLLRSIPYGPEVSDSRSNSGGSSGGTGGSGGCGSSSSSMP